MYWYPKQSLWATHLDHKIEFEMLVQLLNMFIANNKKFIAIANHIVTLLIFFLFNLFHTSNQLLGDYISLVVCLSVCPTREIKL